MVDVRAARAARGSLFEGLAGWSQRHRWWAVAAWVLVLAGVTAGAQLIGDAYRNDFSLPGTESQAAQDTLRARAPTQATDTVQVVLQHPEGLTRPAVRQRVDALLADLAGLPHVATVTDPYESAAARSADGTIGYATVALDALAQDVPPEDLDELVGRARAGAGAGLRVELSGDAVRTVAADEGPPAEAIGILAALAILVVMFGSLLAASLPIVIAVFAVGSTVGLIILASHLATVANFTPYIMILVGLGVGIDYALLIFARYRAELIAGADRERAVRTALDTAGRTVVFAAVTVIIALLGLVVLGLGLLQGVAVAVSLTVLVTMIASITLLPALLAIVGRRVERSVRRRAERRARRARGADGAAWRRWAGLVQRRPWLAAVLPLAALLALAAPALGMRMGFADAGNDPASSTARQAYDLLAEGFGPGFNGPLVVLVQGDDAATQALLATLSGTPGVASAVPAGGASGGGVATVLVLPESKPQAVETTALVNRLRADVLPPVAERTGATFLVGGATAAAVDFADAIADRLPLFIGVVVGLSALLLMIVFRSLLIPVKAAVFNLLSVAASLGVVTLVFQEGFLGEVIGVAPGPVEAFVPVMIFAIIFGLSMDYEVFLLSRMHEEWLATGNASRAVREGLAATGRVVTAAAAIMIVVFGAFILSPDRMLKQFGLGLAVAILLDAVVIRCLLLPAVMNLLGRSAWWLPAWLDRRLPRAALERADPVPPGGAGSRPQPTAAMTSSETSKLA